MANLFDREMYKKIFGHYPDGNHEVLDAVQGEDGVYRVPSLEEWPDVQWKYVGHYWGIDHGKGDMGIINVTGV
jgi:hypothetical protein